MKKIIVLFWLFMVSAPSFAQSNETLLKIGDWNIPVSDFTYLYDKNYGKSDTAYNQVSLDEYLDLFIKFKLKVKEAKIRGLGKEKTFQEEFAGYKKQLQKPYLSDNTITEGMIQEAYNRLKKEVRASHILIRVANWDNPEDTLKAYQKLIDVRKDAIEGKEFGKLAQMYSEDPSAKMNSGDLGYFTSLQMVFEFEDAAYNLPVGEVSKPVRTQFGYHIIKVVDKIEARGKRKVAHIMIRSTQGMDVKDSVEAARKAQEIYKKIQEGEDFSELARQFSEDDRSKNDGGKLPWFSTGQVVPAFSEAMFNLKNLGDIAEPVQSPFGWHIIRLDSIQSVEPFEKVKDAIRQRVSSDSRAALSEKLFLEKLKKDNEFIEKEKYVDLAIAELAKDSSLVKGEWKLQEGKLLKKTIFSFGKKDKTAVRDFFRYANENQQAQKLSPRAYAELFYQQFVDKSVIDYETEHLTEKYPDYKHLEQEYFEGLLLFEIMEREVWGKSVEDTAGMNAYFKNNRDKYQWGERAKVSVFSVSDEATLQKLREDLKNDVFTVEGLDLSNLVFELGDTVVDKPRRKELDKVALQLRRNEDYSVLVETYYVEGESEKISQIRFNQVKQYLQGYRIEENRIQFLNKGKLEGELATASIAGGHLKLIVLSSSSKVLENKYNQENALTLQVTEGWFEKGEEGFPANAKWEKGEQLIKDGNRTLLVQIHEVASPRTKELKETKGQVISDYQDFLEKKWLDELRKKYPVSIEKEIFQKLIK